MGIYFDHAATTALDPKVLEAMLPYFSGAFGNASSRHFFGREAIAAVDEARQKVAAAIGAKDSEIYFTSGGTESDNWAIRGAFASVPKEKRHFITTAVEHPAVLRTFEAMEKAGAKVTYIPVNEEGSVSASAVIAAMRDDTALVSVMLANNEVGTIEPVREIAEEARRRGILVHTDAVQAIGSIPVSVKDLSVDLLSLSAHKFKGPKGVGALFVKSGVRLGKIITGGEQERGMRGGTYNTPAIVGLGKAIEIATSGLEARAKKVSAIRDEFVMKVTEAIPAVRLNGAPRGQRLPGNANLCFEGADGESVLLALDMAHIAASGGSACSSGSADPSHVLLAMGLSPARARASLRFSFGEENTSGEIDEAVSVLSRAVSRSREDKTLFKQFRSEKQEI